MDQKKIGGFLKTLRKEKQLTQEQLAEKLGVSNRSVSRWENGVNMPDFDLVIELANLYDVSIDEILDGERRMDMIDKETEKTLLKVAEYENSGNEKFTKRLCGLFIGATLSFVLYGVLDFMGLANKPGYSALASYAMGIVFGTLLVGVLYTSRYGRKIQAAKARFLARIKKSEGVNEKSLNGLGDEA